MIFEHFKFRGFIDDKKETMFSAFRYPYLLTCKRSTLFNTINIATRLDREFSKFRRRGGLNKKATRINFYYRQLQLK